MERSLSPGRGVCQPEFLRQHWLPVLQGLMWAEPSSPGSCPSPLPLGTGEHWLGSPSQLWAPEWALSQMQVTGRPGSRELTVAATSCFQGQRWQQQQLHACSPWLYPQMFPEARFWLRLDHGQPQFLQFPEPASPAFPEVLGVTEQPVSKLLLCLN